MASLNGNTLSFEAVLDDSDFEQGLNAVADKALAFAQEQNRLNELAIKQQKEYARLLYASGDAFKSLDAGTQQQVARLSMLQNEMKQIASAQQTLNERFRDGKIDQESYQKNLANLVAKEREMASEIQHVTAELSRNDAVMRSANGSINQKVAQLSKLKAAYDALGEGDRNAVEIGGKALQDIKELERELEQLKSAMQTMPEFKLGSIAGKQAELSKLKQDYAELAAIDRRNGNIGGKMKQNIIELEKEVNDLNKEFSQTESFAKKAMLAAGAYFSLQTASTFVQDIARVRGEFQQLEISLETILQSKSKADQLLAEVTELAAKTPFSLREVGEGAKLLLAYQFSAEEVTDTLMRLGNVASGLSIPMNELVQLYGKTRTEGRLFAEDLNQYTGRGIPMIAELAKVMGVAEEEVRGLVTAGKVGFKEVEQVMLNMTSAGGSFYQLMEKNSKSLTGQISNLGDAYDKMLNSIGQANEGLFNTAISGATALVENYETVLDILTGLVAVYGSYRAALIATAAVQRVHMALMMAQATSSTALTVAQTLQIANTKLLTLAQAAYNKALALSPIVAYTAVIAALGLAIYSLVQAQSAATAIQERFVSIQGQGAAAAAKERENINQLISVIKSEVATREQKEAALKKLKDATGGVLDGYSKEEIAAGKAKDAIDEYIKSVENATKARVAFDELNKLNEQIAELETKGIEAVSVYDRLGQSLKNTFGAGGVSLEEWGKGLIDGAAQNETIVNQMVESLKQQKKAIEDEYKNSLAEQITGVAGGSDSATAEAVKRTVAVIEEEIKKLKEEQTTVSSTSAEWKAYENQLKSLEAEKTRITGSMSKEVKKWAEDRKKILEDLAKAEKEAANAGLSANEKEIAANKEKYDQLRKLVEDFNRDAPKSQQISVGVVARIDRLEESTTGEILYKQETEALKESLDKQKELYAEFEEYKKNFGAEKAKERFKNELDLSKTHRQQLQEELDKLNAIAPADLTEPKIERKEYLVKQLEADKKAQQAAYDDLLKSLTAYEQQRKLIMEQYAEDRERLLVGGDIAALEELDRKYQENLNALDDTAAKKLDAFKNLFAGIDELSDKQARAVVTLAENKLKELVAQGRISKEMQQEIEKLLRNTTASINDRLPQRLANLAGSIRGVAGAVAGVDEEFAKILGTLSHVIDGVVQVKDGITAMQKASGSDDILGGITGAMSVIGGVMVAINLAKSLADSLNAKEERRKARQEAQNKFDREQEMKGIEAITKALDRQLAIIKEIYGTERLEKYRISLINIKNEYDKMAEQLSKKIILSGDNKETDDLITKFNNGELDMAYWTPKFDSAIADGTIKTLDEIIKKLGDVKTNSEAIEDLQQLLDKGLLDDTTAKQVETLVALGEKYRETLNAIRAETTGFALDSWIEEMVQIFAKGGADSAQAFSDNFDEQIKKSLLQSFKRQYLEKQMQEIYEMFAKYAGPDSGGVLDDNEIKELRDAYQKAVENAKDGFKELEKIIGETLAEGPADQQGLAGAIRGITAEQADLLAGQFGGLRIHVAAIEQMLRAQISPTADPTINYAATQTLIMQEMNRAIIQTFAVNQQIEINTRQTAANTAQALNRLAEVASEGREHTKSLKSIDTKIGSTNEILRANGG